MDQKGGSKRRRGSGQSSIATTVTQPSLIDARNMFYKRVRGCNGIAIEQSQSIQLPFYGFYSTTSFDQPSLSASEAVVLAEEMSIDFYSEASMMYEMIIDFKSQNEEGEAANDTFESIRESRTRLFKRFLTRLQYPRGL